MALEIRLLGEFEVFSTGAVSAAISARKARALLVYLCLKAGRPQQRDNLARLLWGDVSQEDHARKSLRQALTVLRRELPDELIEATRDELCLNPAAASIDAREFERLAKSPDRAELERSIELYRGELLEGFQSRADAFDDWLASERRRLREQAIGALERVLEVQRAEHDLTGATRSAIRMVSLDPLHEPAHRRLMLLYAEQGRLGDALNLYENCRQVLQRELGRGPDPATTQLLQSLKHSRGTPSVRHHPSTPDLAPQLRVMAVLVATRHSAERTDEVSLQRVSQAIDEQGGLLLRRTQNSVTGVFGTLRSQGSEAARAVCAAERAALLAQDYGYGVSLAQAMVTQVDGSVHVVGEAISHAAHLAATASAATIVVSESVRQALRDSALTQDVRLAPQRDSDGRIHAWRVSDCSESESNTALRNFVGRARELGILRAALVACQNTNTGQLVRIRGEAGIGKTRLLEELLSIAAAEGFLIQRAAALDFGRRSERDVVAQLARGLIESRAAPSRPEPESDTAEPVSSRDHGLLLELAALEGNLPREAAEHSVREARAERQRELWLRLWQQLLAQGPALVAIEDLHWANESAFEYLAALLSLSHTSPLLLVVTSRPGMLPNSPYWLGTLKSAAVLSLDLGPLSAKEGRELARELAIDQRDHIEAAIERSGGHPLFLEQILRAKRPAHLTPSIHVVVQTRLDQLAPFEATALRAAAVLGHRFDLSTLSELIQGDVPTEGLLRSGLIKNVATRFMFSHALIRDAAYETLPPATRSTLHARAAEVVRRQDRALAAEHLRLAQDPGAAEAYLEAAQEADRSERVSEAFKLAEAGLSLATDASLTFTLMLLRGHLLGRLGQRDAAEESARDTLALAATSPQRTRAWLALAECLRGTPRDSEALDALRSAEQAAASDDHEARSHLHYLRGNVLFPRAEADACLTSHQQALQHSKRGGSPHAEARALSGLGDAYYIQGDLQRASAHFDACAALADQLGLVRLARVNRVMVELVRLFCLDQPEQVLNALTSHADLARDELDLPGEAVARSSAICVVKLRDEPVPLEQMARRVVEVARRSGRQRLGLASHAWIIEAQVDQGLAVDADRELDAIYQRCTGPEAAFAALNVLGSMLACCRDAQRRNMLYAEAERIVEGGQFVSHCLYIFSRSALIDCLLHNDHERLEHCALRLEAYTESHQVAWGSYYCDWARTLSAWHSGQRDEATRSHLMGLESRAIQLGLSREARLVGAALFQPGVEPVRANSVPRSTHTR